MMFQDRERAGDELAKKLEAYGNSDAIVLALPRGGVVVGHEIARQLNLPLDVVITRKIGHPWNPEFAVCVTDELGTLLCNESQQQRLDPEWLKEEVERQKIEAKRRATLYRQGREPIPIRGKTAIVTDDGIATGLTLRLAVMLVKKEKPKCIVVAVPVAPPDAIYKLKQEVDEVIVLAPPETFVGAVGAHYSTFEQVDDETVVQLLSS